MPKIREANPDEYESILRFLGEAYGVSRDFFPMRYPSWWGKNTDFSRIWLMDRGGRIESLVRIYPLTLVLGETRLPVGGIGAVSTHPDARGQGHMHHLLYRAIEEMKKEFALSVLWGDRHRYRLFGYELGGSVLQVRIGSRGLWKMGIKALSPKIYYGERDVLNRIRECYRSGPFHRVRTEGEDELIYGRSGLMVWTGGDAQHFGYLALLKERGQLTVAEFGGNARTVLGLAAYRFAATGADSLVFPFPNRQTVESDYREAASGWSIEPAASIKVLHLSSVIERFRPWLSNNPDAADPALLHLPETEVVERLFGAGRPGAAPFFCWPLDHI